jgi:hypothetical protein
MFRYLIAAHGNAGMTGVTNVVARPPPLDLYRPISTPAGARGTVVLSFAAPRLVPECDCASQWSELLRTRSKRSESGAAPERS